jgi:hypothetical protein
MVFFISKKTEFFIVTVLETLSIAKPFLVPSDVKFSSLCLLLKMFSDIVYKPEGMKD